MQVTLPGGQVAEIPDDWTQAQRADAVSNYMKSPAFASTVDQSTGAPASVRLRVGGSPEGDRLANLRKFFPDAVPYGSDNFVFTNPDTGKPTLYNPKGFDFGDVASMGREVTTSVGA